MSQPPRPPAAPADAPPRPVSFGEALRFWTYLGFVSFGGPAGQIAIMHTELVEKRRWISERRFLHALSYCMLLPGPEAQQLATYVGWLLHGPRGGIAAGTLFILPSVFVLWALAWVYMAYGKLPVVAGVLEGFKPAVMAVVLFAVVRIGKRALRSPQAWVVAALAFVGIFALGVPFPLIVALAAVAGVVSARLWPGSFSLKDAHGASATAEGAADLGAAAAHARPSRGQLLVQGALGLLLWAAPLVALLLWQGRDGVHTRMGWFFTKAALVTFGGAYAVLPYVAQVAIEEYRWVTATQMIDGLALGETTPGPLIMVVAFVGYVGAWQAGGGPWGGALGLLVATWFTFLPSFLFILLGAPVVERTHGNVRLTAALNGITAAVVGVILNLGVFFGLHVLWRDGRLDLFALGVTAAALVAQWRFGLGVIPVVLASGVLGLLHRLLLGG